MWKKIKEFRKAKAMAKEWVIINDEKMKLLEELLPKKWYDKIVRLSVFDTRMIVK